MTENCKNDELLLNCLKGKADEQEYEIAYRWINSSKSNFEYYESLRDAWIAAGIITLRSEYNCFKAWNRLAKRTGIRFIGLPEIYTSWSRVASIFILAFIFGVVTYHFLHGFLTFTRPLTENEFVVEAPLGAKSRIVLSDNTKVWLNAGSTLRYSTGYDDKERDVYLTGEAYFKVVSNRKLPFRVHASGLVINALGTEFNVKDYPEEATIETILVSGLLSLENKSPINDFEKILLGPNQRATFTKADPGIVIDQVTRDKITSEVKAEQVMKVLPILISVESAVNTELYTSWKDNRLIFQRKKIADLAIKLERLYDVEIIIGDEELKNYHLSGSLEEETLEQFLSAIRLTIPIDFDIHKNRVVLSLNKELKEKYNKISN